MLSDLEVVAVLSSRQAVTRCVTWLLNHVEIDNAAGDLTRTLEIAGKYRDLPADFADASLVALCERRDTHRIATVDSDFEVYRLPGRRAFENVFLIDT